MTAVLRPALVGLGATLGAILLGVAAVAALTAAAALNADVARTWLILFGIGSAAPVGATVLLMIGTLTGGAWGSAWRPVLAPLATWTILAAAAFVPVAVALPAIYPWAADPGTAPPGVARLYLNPPFFILRATVALGGWTALGLLFGLGYPSRLTAGLGLAFHGIAVSLVSVDWFLSVEPGYTSSDFPALVAIGQIATALALVAVLGAGAGDRPGAAAARSGGDLGSLLIATQVGIGYLGLMAFIIAWYGDLPGTIDWYVRRSAPAPLALLLAAAVTGVVVPFAILLRSAWRAGGPMLALAGGGVLLGLSLHELWLLGPALGAVPTAAAGLALVPLAAGLAWLHRARHRSGGHV